jgi:LCP family protein required for cell wall assembly
MLAVFLLVTGVPAAASEIAPAPESIPVATPAPGAGDTAKPEADALHVTQGLDERWINILLLGGDSRSAGSYARTDSMIILSINPETAGVKMSSIMRDTWVNLYGVGWNKINAANVYGGPELAMRTVNENFGMNITYYAMVNMTALAEVVDEVGGIKLDITKAEMREINSQMASFSVSSLDQSKLNSYGAGTRLTGNQALAYARNRAIGNDYERTERQRKVLVAIAQKLKDNNVLTVAATVTSLLKYVSTNLDLETLLKLAATALGADVSNIPQLRVPADGTFDAGMKDGIWTIRPDFAKNTQLLNDFIYADEG